MRSVLRRVARSVTAATAAILMSRCMLTPQRNPVPPVLAEAATMPGIPYVRHWGDQPLSNLNERIGATKALVCFLPFQTTQNGRM